MSAKAQLVDKSRNLEMLCLCSVTGCGKKYKSMSHLQRHHKITHLGFSYVCSEKGCQIKFTSSWALKKHCKNVHERTGVFRCSCCDIMFHNKREISLHIKSNKKLQFTCTVCSKSWSRESLFKRHMRSHAIRKCLHKNCAAVFQTYSELRKHMAEAHSNEFNCNHCNKQFSLKSRLQDHMVQHFPSGENLNFKCIYKECSRSYRYERNLSHHVATYHALPRYYCDQRECRLSYFNEASLAAHKKRQHKIPLDNGAAKDAFISRLLSSVPTGSDDIKSTELLAEESGRKLDKVFFIVRSSSVKTVEKNIN